jgi:hypothetical protein
MTSQFSKQQSPTSARQIEASDERGAEYGALAPLSPDLPTIDVQSAAMQMWQPPLGAPTHV